jgi:hypothetical protein
MRITPARARGAARASASVANPGLNSPKLRLEDLEENTVTGTTSAGQLLVRAWHICDTQQDQERERQPDDDGNHQRLKERAQCEVLVRFARDGGALAKQRVSADSYTVEVGERCACRVVVAVGSRVRQALARGSRRRGYMYVYSAIASAHLSSRKPRNERISEPRARMGALQAKNASELQGQWPSTRLQRDPTEGAFPSSISRLEFDIRLVRALSPNQMPCSAANAPSSATYKNGVYVRVARVCTRE